MSWFHFITDDLLLLRRREVTALRIPPIKASLAGVKF